MSPTSYKHWVWLGLEVLRSPLLTLFSLIPAVPSSPMKRWSQQIRPLLRLGLPVSLVPIPPAILMFSLENTGSREEIISS